MSRPTGSVERRSVLTIERRPIGAVERRPARATALEGLAVIAVRPSLRARPVLESPARLGAIIRKPPVGRAVSLAARASGTEPARALTSWAVRRSSSMIAPSGLPPRRAVASAGAVSTAAGPGPGTARTGSRSIGSAHVRVALRADAKAATCRTIVVLGRACRGRLRVTLPHGRSWAGPARRPSLLRLAVTGLLRWRRVGLVVRLSHVRPPRAGASAGRRGCPRRRCPAPPARRGADRKPPNRAPPEPRSAR